MLIWIIVIIAAVGLATISARAASERGRRPALWATFSGGAGVIGQVVGTLLFGWALTSDPSTVSIGPFLFGLLASLLGPLVCMFAVYALLLRLPEQVPQIGGESWSVYWLSSNNADGRECRLSVEEGRLRLDDVIVGAAELSEIAVDGECLRLSWAGQSALLLPVGKSRTARERTKQSLGIERRLRELLR